LEETRSRLKIIQDMDFCEAKCRAQLRRINCPRGIGEHTTIVANRPSNREQRLTHWHLPTMTVQERGDGVRKSGEVRYGKPFDRTKNTI
jgi:hypothetical protein